MLRMRKLWLLCGIAVALGVSSPSSARQDCVYKPTLEKRAKGLYVRESRLQCREVAPEPASVLQQAREFLALCAELGVEADRCAALLRESAEPELRQVLDRIEAGPTVAAD